MNRYKLFIVGLLILTLLSGCAAYIGGDLRNTEPSYVPLCKLEKRDYIISITDNAKNDYCDQNIFGYITALTLGILPTYWMSPIVSNVSVQDKNGIIHQYKFKSRVHKFYGIIWLFILPQSELNSIGADEGVGIRVESGVHTRVMTKILQQEYLDLNIDNACQN